MTPSPEIEAMQKTMQQLLLTLNIQYAAIKNIQQRVDRLENMSLDIYRRIDNLTGLKKEKGDAICKDNAKDAQQQYPMPFRTHAGTGEAGTGQGH